MVLEQTGLEWVNKNLNGFIGGIGRGNDAMQTTGTTAEKASLGLSVLGGAVMGVASSVTGFLLDGIVNVGKAMVGLGVNSVGLAAEFQGLSTGLQIAGKAAAEDAGVALEDLSEIALQVGGDTRLLGVSATGAASSMTDLLKNGISLTDILGDVNGYMDEGAQLGGILRASIDLAAASELDMVRASNLAGTSMKIFGLTAEQVNATMDYFVRSADASAADVSDIEQAIVGAGPVMKSFGFSVNETSDAIAILSNTGIRGAEAGTALRSMFTNLSRQTPKVTDALEANGIALTDNEGKYLSFVEIMGQFELAMDGMTEAEKTNFAQTVAGSYGKTALLSIVGQGVEGWAQYQAAVESATGIEAQAEARSQTYAGQMEAMQGNLETLKIRIGTALLPALTEMVSFFSEIVEQHGPLLISIFEAIGTGITQAVSMAIPWLQEHLPTAINTVSGFITETLVPAIQTAIQWLQTNVPIAIQIVSEFINGVLVPAFNTAVAFIQGSVIPVITTMVEWLQTNVPVAIQVVSEFFNGTFLPTVQAVAAFINDTLVPYFRVFADVIKTNLSSVVMLISSIFRTVFLPVIQVVAALLKDIVIPIIEGVAKVLIQTLGLAIRAITGIIETQFLPILKAINDWIKDKVVPAIDSFSKAFNFGLKGAINDIAGAIGGLLGWFDRLAQKIASVKLPDWMKPGSPPPLFYALNDISEATRGVTQAMSSMGNTMSNLTPSMGGAGGGITQSQTMMPIMQPSNQDNSRSINVEMNPTYTGYTPASMLYYDLESALANAVTQ